MQQCDAHKRREDRGFTLAEMVVTSIIAGVLMAVTAPSLVGMMEQARVTDSVSQIKAAIQQAQRQAMRRGRSCNITIDIDETKIKVTDNTNDNGCLLEEIVLPSSVSLTANISGDPNISFSPKGNNITASDSMPDGGLILTVSRKGSNTNQKCVLLSGKLGIVKTGNYESSNCNVN